MSKFNKIIEELLLEHSQTYPFPSLDDKEQVKHLMECCDKLGYSEYKDIIREFFLNEAEPQPQQSGHSGESKDFPGKFHLGGGYYSSKENGPAEFKNDKGNLRVLTPDEKAKFDSKGMAAEKPANEPTQNEPTEPTSKSSTDSKKGTSAIKKVAKVAKDTASNVVDVATQHKEKIQQKIQNWSDDEKAFFNNGQDNPGSETRRSFAEALKDKVKGAGAAIKHGFQHEVHLFKNAATAAHKWVKGEELTKEDKKAMIGVGVKVVTTALTGAAFGGAAHGAVAFAKHVAMELAPHIVAETIALGTIRATLFADVNADERVLMDFADKIADRFENMDISPEIMDDIIDKWNGVRETPQMESITLDELLESILLKEAEGESLQFPGKFHLGGGYYSSKQGGEAEFKNDNGNLRPITPEEKAEFEANGGSVDQSKEHEYIKTAEKELDKKEKEIEDANKPNPKEEPEKVLDDPKASTRDRAMARTFKSEKDNLERRRMDDPEYQSKLKKEVIAKTAEISNELRGREDSEGNILDSETTDNGSILIGVEHGADNESTHEVIQQIKQLPKDAKVVFLGEGGSEIDENGKFDFIDEQDEIRDAVMNHFDYPKEMSWDENSNVRDDNSPIFDDIALKLGGSKEKALASVWTNMVGQGDTDLASEDYLNDATKQWIKEQAKKGGSEEFNGDVDWDNLTLEQKEDLYELNYRDDQNYGETELFTGQKAYNDYRQGQLDRKIKEIEDTGSIAIASMGNDHVGAWRERNKPTKNTFKPTSLRNFNKEMPDADSSVFTNQSDIDKIPEDKKKEISMKIDELADKANKGEDFNLCQITVPGTNLYCDDNQGIPREEMPQFKGKPLPGTPAASMPKDSKGEVDTEPLFKKMLKEKGIKTIETELPSDKLKATQSELVGSKVAGMTKALEEDPNNPGITAPIYVSRDGYVIDGHHRWAAVTSNAIKNGKPANMKVIVVDMDIKDAIPMCNKFAEEQGIAAKKADANDGTKDTQPKPEEADKTPNGVVYNVGGDYYSDKPNGPAQYIKTESVIEKVFIDENQDFVNFLFETNVTKQTTDGETLKLKVIDPKDQPEATADAKSADEKGGNVEPIKGDWEGKALSQMSQSKYNDSILDDKLKQSISTIIGKMTSGQDLSDEEKQIAKDYIKIVKTDAKVKLYIASKKKGDWSQQGYVKVEIGSGNLAKKWADEASGKYDVTSGAASQGAIGKKQISPAKANSKRKIAKIENVDENTIKINGKTMKTLPVLTFDEIKPTLQQQNPELDEKEINKRAAILEKRIKRYNDNIGTLRRMAERGEGDLEYVDYGEVDTPEERNKTIQNMVDIAKADFTRRLGDKAELPENKIVLDTLDSLKEYEGVDLETDEVKRKEYEDKLNQLIVHMTNSKDFRDGVADFVELKVAMELLGKGNPVYLPSSETFKVADLLVINPIDLGEGETGIDASEKLSKNLKLLYVTLEFSGGVSVKYQGGGAGNSDEKVKKTRFHNNESRKRINGILSTYDVMYPDNRTPPGFPPSQEKLDELSSTFEDNKKWMVENDIATEAEINAAQNWADKRIEAVLSTFQKNGVGDCMSDDEKNRFKETMRAYYRGQKLMEVIYNNDAEYTTFGNANQKIKISKGKAVASEAESTDGVEGICYMKIKDDVGFNYSQQGGCVTVKPSNRNPSEIHAHKPTIK